jgi:hypothetical protein
VIVDCPPNSTSGLLDCIVTEIVIFWTEIKLAARSPLQFEGLPVEKQ